MTTTDVNAGMPRPTARFLRAPRPGTLGRLALLLLGLPAPVRTERLPEAHGQRMLIGFLGTVIALERAVAAHR